MKPPVDKLKNIRRLFICVACGEHFPRRFKFYLRKGFGVCDGCWKEHLK